MPQAQQTEIATQDAAQNIDAVLTIINIPNIGTYWPEAGGIYAGIMRGKKGQPMYHLVHAAKEHEIAAVNWQSAVEKATVPINGFTDWSLPDRREGRLLSINSPDSFNKNRLYWLSEQNAAFPDSAWIQGFSGGRQSYGRKSTKYLAFAVRRILIIR